MYNNDHDNNDRDNNAYLFGPGRGMAIAVLWGAAFRVGLALLIIFLSGCASVVGPKTTEEPLRAESGAGVTIWKVPVLGIGVWGVSSSGQIPSVIIHKYDYQAQPPALAPGTPPSPPWMTSVVDYPTIYSSSWDDPTLVVFKNDSYRKVRIEIDGQRPIVLSPYGATSDIHLGLGEHRVRLTIEKPTRAHGTLEVVKFFKIRISPCSRSRIIHIYDH